MAKSNIANINTTQTFQNWLDKTNEMVDLFRDQVITATPTGDSTTGDAILLGEFTANTIIAYDDFEVDAVTARTPGGTIDYTSPVSIEAAASPVSATFKYGASGGRTRYATNTTSWEIGYDNATDQNFIMNTGSGGQFKLSPAGVLTVPSIVTSADVQINSDLTLSGHLEANTANFQSANGTFTGIFSGNFTGDIYHPQGNKVFENGGPDAAIPATFTGNVNGTVSSLTNHTTNALKEGTTNLYFKNSRVRGALTAGTGVTIGTDPNDVDKAYISIGQAVNTTSSVTFGSLNVEGKTTTTDDLTVDGAILASGDITAFGSVSDIRQKENIKPIESALDKVSKLGGYTYNYKGNNTPLTGVIAQELLEVLPEAVYKTVDPDTNEEIYAVRHGNIVGLLIEAIKELQEKVGK